MKKLTKKQKHEKKETPSKKKMEAKKGKS